MTWKELIKDARYSANCSDQELFGRVQVLVDEFDVVRVEVCRETDRFRVPKPGVDLNRLKYRLIVILNRESENVEGFGGTLKSGNY